MVRKPILQVELQDPKTTREMCTLASSGSCTSRFIMAHDTEQIKYNHWSAYVKYTPFKVHSGLKWLQS